VEIFLDSEIGQTLFALAESGALSRTSPAYRKGVQFLLGTQLADGSWYVQRRTLPSQTYFDSEFPHGTDQFISTAATNWLLWHWHLRRADLNYFAPSISEFV
jgi:hypothetical protein